MAASTIDEVIAALKNIIDTSIHNNSRTGYFAALYYKVTVRVKQGIAAGEFEDGARMEKLDVVFASRYLDALADWENKREVTASWQTAFNATGKRYVLLLQHLLMGINAHINLDLGIAAATIAKGYPLADIKKDFATINTIIASLTYEMLNDLSRVSPLLSLLGLHATNYVSVLVQFSIGNARDGAWSFAEDLSAKTSDDYDQLITDRDKTIAQLGSELVHVQGVMRFTCWLIHIFEWKNPAKIITLLHGYVKKYFSFNK
jgi:hypothetical protein